VTCEVLEKHAPRILWLSERCDFLRTDCIIFTAEH